MKPQSASNLAPGRTAPARRVFGLYGENEEKVAHVVFAPICQTAELLAPDRQALWRLIRKEG